jgi:integrase
VVKDLAFTADGLEVTVRRSKTDQEGRGMLKALPYSGTPDVCPVRALRAWLDGAGITEGPVFREVDRHGRVGAVALSGQSVSTIVKGAAVAAGIEAERVSGHSLRAGFVTQAKVARKDEAAIMRQTGHRSVAMVRKYDRRASLWTDNAAAGLLD